MKPAMAVLESVELARDLVKQKQHRLEEARCEAQVCSTLLLLLEIHNHHVRTLNGQLQIVDPLEPIRQNSRRRG